MSKLTFGELVKNQMQNPSDDVVKAAEYVIQFGKHKGMNLSMLMEEQHSYCMWLIKQDESQNSKFNDAVHHIKILFAEDHILYEEKVDGVDTDNTVFEGGVIDLGAENKQTVMKDYHADNLIIDKGVVKVDGVEVIDGDIMVLNIDHGKTKPVVGLIMGTVTDLMHQVDQGLTFDFSHEDIDVWLGLVSKVELGENYFVIIETQYKFEESDESHAQKIKMVVSDLKKLKGVF